MHVMILGLRGIPETEGGIERHVECLAPILADRGLKVTALLRSPYKPSDGDLPWRGVERVWLWAPRSAGLETIINTLIGVLYAAVKRPDVLHFHGIGPALLVPIARLAGLKVVMTHHGFDYDREKWGVFARLMLQLGERFGVRLSHQVIVISKTIQSSLRTRFGRICSLIPNGVDLPTVTDSIEHLQPFGLRSKRYVLQVGRFVPEKRQIDLIKAFVAAKLPDWKLVLVGRLDAEDPYVRRVSELAQCSDAIVLTGFQTGSALQELYANAGVFVLPSSHEGLPIALLEAMSFGLPVIASDIDAHKELELPTESYFKVGDVYDLTSGLLDMIRRTECDPSGRTYRGLVVNKYNWPDIGERTQSELEAVARLPTHRTKIHGV